MRYSFDDPERLFNQFARSLIAHGGGQGDRVGILLPQAPGTAVAHLAIYKIGAITVPLFTLFGTDALEFRVSDSGATALVTNREGIGKLQEIRSSLPGLSTVFDVEAAPPEGGYFPFSGELEGQSPQFPPVRTTACDPPVIIYTSGTTGKPKGARHAHRVLPGHVPGVELSHNLIPERAGLTWTPANWAWIGGQFDVFFSSWHHGMPVRRAASRNSTLRLPST